ncbi:hypothetical protein CYY_003716 [Polysphondylium violaceum]|uniref:Uncharacterized protein n=1 Tax=Polysphondylium violaceum TaxID=133409 RepID=A0A8J4PWE0_9MYCE|nr:hypothetical protein CYY_003716 [Polysphondylium violaceum]
MKYILIIYLAILCVKWSNSQFTSTGFPIKVLSDTSPWNTVIGPSPTYDSYSAAMMTRISSILTDNNISPVLGFAYYQWTAPIHLIDSSLSTVNRIVIYQPENTGYHETVDPLNTQRIENLPVSSTFNPDPMADGHMIVFDTSLKEFHEFSRFKWINSTYASATRYDRFAYNAIGTYPAYVPGTRWWMKSVRGAGAPFIAGLIRWDEMVRGDLNHALAFSGPVNRIKALSTSPWTTELCTPVAARSDGYALGPDTIMEGQRLQLNPSLDISSLPPKAKLIAQALKTYGGYMVDNAHGFNIYFEYKGPYATSSWNTYASDIGTLAGIPLSQFRVISCSTIATK